LGTKIKQEGLMTKSEASPSMAGTDSRPAKARILDAAFAAFSEAGYAQTSMLEIATRAKVSKRELYALVGNKHDMLVACITERAGRLHPPAGTPEPTDREALADALALFGERLLLEVTQPAVLGVFRLAIAEAERAPEIAGALQSIARSTARSELALLLDKARTRGLLAGVPEELAALFTALLWGDLMIDLLLRVADPPTPQQAARRAQQATASFMHLHPAKP
jgi:AcrR family transcriptional regulator